MMSVVAVPTPSPLVAKGGSIEKFCIEVINYLRTHPPTHLPINRSPFKLASHGLVTCSGGLVGWWAGGLVGWSAGRLVGW